MARAFQSSFLALTEYERSRMNASETIVTAQFPTSGKEQAMSFLMVLVDANFIGNASDAKSSIRMHSFDTPASTNMNESNT